MSVAGGIGGVRGEVVPCGVVVEEHLKAAQERFERVKNSCLGCRATRFL